MEEKAKRRNDCPKTKRSVSNVGTKAAVGAVAVFLACAGVAAPCTLPAVFPVLSVLLYALSFAVGWQLLPISAAALLAAGFLAHGAHVFFAAAALCAAGLTLPRLVRKRLSLWAEIALCAAVGLSAVCATFGVYALVVRETVPEAIARAYRGLPSDPLLAALSQRYYTGLSAEALGHTPLSRYDELFAADALGAYAAMTEREVRGSTLWYLSGFGVFAGGTAGAAGMALRQTVCGEKTPKWSELRLGRTYLLGDVLPALVFACFSLYEPMRPVVRAVVNVMVTLPTALCGVTLWYHTLSRVRGKAKIAALACFWLTIAAAALFYEWGLLVFGFLGLADAILDVRRLLDWALS